MSRDIVNNRVVELLYFGPSYSESEQIRTREYLDAIQRANNSITIIEIDARGRQRQDELYEEFFGNPRVSQLVRRRAGKKPSQLFERSSGTGVRYLRGVVALREGGFIQWANNAPQSYILLDNLVNRGLQAIDELYEYADKIKSEEVDLLDIFEASDHSNGRIERNYWIPASDGPSFFNETSKYIDAVLYSPSGEVLTIEVEMTLGYTAIGQALCYEQWFRMMNNAESTRPAIVCGSANKEFITSSEDLGILTYLITGSEVVLLNRE